jgi:GNAT superfamily N-acetyltransferase
MLHGFLQFGWIMIGYQFVTSGEFRQQKHVSFSELELLAKASFVGRGRRIVPGHLENLASTGETMLLLAWKDKERRQLVGYNLFVYDVLNHLGGLHPFLYADKVVVHPDHMGNGIGKMLVTLPLGWTRANQKKLMVGLRTSDPNLVPFYSSIAENLEKSGIPCDNHTIGNSSGGAYEVFLYGTDRFSEVELPLVEHYIAEKQKTLEYASFFRRAATAVIGVLGRSLFSPRFISYVRQ